MAVFVTVAVFSFPHEAMVPESLLAAEGIKCFVKDSNTIQVYQLYSNAIGGVKLQVPAADAERAIEILREGGFLPAQVNNNAAFEERPNTAPVGRPTALLIVIGVIIMAIAAIYLLNRRGRLFS